MKRILIPIDFTDDSKHAVEYVLDFVKETKTPCELLLLNTYIVKETDPSQVIKVNDELKKRSKTGLEQERQDILAKITNPLITVKTFSQMGSLNNVICQFIQREKVDLVALEKDVESVSTMLKQQQCPVLLTYA